MKHPTHQHGLTLIEALASIAVLAICAGTAAPRLTEVLDRYRLDAAAAQLAADVHLARNESLSRQQAVRLTWPAGQSCYVVHTGAADACRCDAGATAARCDAGAVQIRTVRWSTADRVALQANASSLLFDPLHGTVSPTATLRVVGPDGRAIHHVVNVMGRVRSCSPGGAVSGQRPC